MYTNALAQRRKQVTDRLADMLQGFLCREGGALYDKSSEDLAQCTGLNSHRADTLTKGVASWWDIPELAQAAGFDLGIVIRDAEGGTREFWPNNNFSEPLPLREKEARKIITPPPVKNRTGAGITIYRGTEKPRGKIQFGRPIKEVLDEASAALAAEDAAANTTSQEALTCGYEDDTDIKGSDQPC